MDPQQCICYPGKNPSVIGSCACPIHGMKALREAGLQLLRHPRSARAALGMHRALGTNPLTYHREDAVATTGEEARDA